MEFLSEEEDGVAGVEAGFFWSFLPCCWPLSCFCPLLDCWPEEDLSEEVGLLEEVEADAEADFLSRLISD